MLANPPLQEAAIASLERDPRIPDPLTIAVSAQGNVVTLRGIVETFRQRHAAHEGMPDEHDHGWAVDDR